MTFYLILAFSVFFISLIGTKLVIMTLKNRAHSPDIKIVTGKQKREVPDNGGIALVFSVIIGLLGAEIDYTIIAGIFLLTGIPMLAAILPFPKIIKLSLRLAAIILVLEIFKTPVFSDDISPLFDKTLSALFWLWIIHAFDKMERVEGLLSVEMITIGGGIYLLTALSDNFFSDASLYSLIFAVAGVGFLWWNAYPAKVKAGEIASVPMGFVAGFLLLFAASKGYGTIVFILPAYFLADSAITFLNRPFSEKLVREEQAEPTIPYCLRAIKNSNSPQWVVRTIAGINLLLAFLATQILISSQMLVFNIILAYIMTFVLIALFARVRNKTI